MRIIAILCVAGLALTAAFDASAQNIRLLLSSGQATVQSPGETAPRPPVKDELLAVGSRIVTGPDGRVVIAPLPGVKSILAPNTTLVIESVSETGNPSLDVTHHAVLDLKEGNVVSDLNKPKRVTYDYSIRTPRGLAGARGTTFTVGYNAAGIQTITVAHGTISITFADGRVATLTPGQLSVSKPGAEPQNVSKVEELSPEDQQSAQAVAETTINAIADAVANGVELDPNALNNAVDAAKSLGITLSPETQARVDSVLQSTLTKKEEQADPKKTTGTTDNSNTTKEVVTETTANPSAIDTFRARMNGSLQEVFDTLPLDLKELLAVMNDLDIATLALSPDPESGLRYTDQDLRFHLRAFASSSLTTLDFIKKLAGNSLSNIDYAPDPAEWSPEAFTRSIAVFNSLTSGEQTLVVEMGAGEALMDTSASYISALLATFDPQQQSLIASTGWGRQLADLATNPQSSLIFSEASQFNPAELAAVKFFDVDPFTLFSPNTVNGIKALAQLTGGSRDLARALGIGDFVISEASQPVFNAAFFESPSLDQQHFADRIAAAFAFYNQLTPAEQIAVRATGIGDILYFQTPDTTFGESTTTALQVVQQISAFYNNNPDLQQAIRDSALFSREHFSAFIFQGDLLNDALLRETLTAYLASPERTRLFLSLNDKYSFFEIANPEAFSGNFSYRPLSDINAILAGLTQAEFQTLSDLQIARVIAESTELPQRDAPSLDFLGATNTDRVQKLKDTVAFFNQLGSDKKFVMRELGIIGHGQFGEDNIAFVGADSAGLNRLLTVYASLSGGLRASTEKLFEANLSEGGSFGTENAGDRSYFFPSGFDINHVLQNVTFQSNGDLYVGATRYLQINNLFSQIGFTFSPGFQKDVQLYAADLIDLTGVSFASQTRGIIMAAATINLTDIDFPSTAVVSLNSKLGQANFGSVQPGMVNFNNVSYGGNSLNTPTDLTSPTGAAGNIVIGTLANPAPLPTHTPVNLP